MKKLCELAEKHYKNMFGFLKQIDIENITKADRIEYLKKHRGEKQIVMIMLFFFKIYNKNQHCIAEPTDRIFTYL